MRFGLGLSRKTAYFLLAAAIGIVMFSSGEAAAGDAKRVPGSICRFENQSVHRASAAKGGGFQNTSGASQTVICPITKDDLSAAMSVYVRVDDTLGETSCQVVWFVGDSFVAQALRSDVQDFVGATKDLEIRERDQRQQRRLHVCRPVHAAQHVQRLRTAVVRGMTTLSQSRGSRGQE